MYLVIYGWGDGSDDGYGNIHAFSLRDTLCNDYGKGETSGYGYRSYDEYG